MNRILSIFGLQIRKLRLSRTSHRGALEHLHKQIDFSHVYDVGAARGQFSEVALSFWADANYYLFEPLEEFSAPLERGFGQNPQFKIVSLALWSKVESVTLNVHRDLYGSSIYKEVEGSFVDGEPRKITTTVLDEFYASGGNILVKLDVQGAELDVLEGASKFFDHQSGGEVIFLLEVGLYNTMINSKNVFHHVVEFFAQKNYVLVDIAGMMYRPLDQNLAQLDVVFCHKESAFRSSHAYATPEFREKQFGNNWFGA
jgi:FkbM family methyltransferase